MKLGLSTVLVTVLTASAAYAQQPRPEEAAVRICADPHGQAPPAAYASIAAQGGGLRR